MIRSRLCAILHTQGRHLPRDSKIIRGFPGRQYTMAAPATMKAVVLRQPGGPEVLTVEQLPVPKPAQGQVLIRVKAFGLNRSEMFTRQGHSPVSQVTLPRVLGIEAAGVVEEAPGTDFEKGQRVITCMGGMGRLFDGGYAEYTCVPARQVQRVDVDLDWPTLGALPEMLQTAWGALFRALKLQKGDSLLIRGGTSSVGLAAAAIAKHHGYTVTSTTRQTGKEGFLQEHGATNVIVDDGAIGDKPQYTAAFDKVLELVGTTTLDDSLRCTKEGGIVCLAGIVGNKWTIENFRPLASIGVGVCLTTYGGTYEDLFSPGLSDFYSVIRDGKVKIPIKVFRIDDIVEAHRLMDSNKAGGKIVVLT